MREFKLATGMAYYDGKGLLFAAVSCNGLFYYEIEKNTTISIGEFEKNSIWCQGMFKYLAKVNNNIFFLPNSAVGIPYYNLETKEIKYCDMPIQLKKKNLSVFGYVRRGKYIYGFPLKLSDPVLVVDIKNKQIIKIIDSWNKKLNNHIQVENNTFLTGLSYCGEKLWITCNQINGIFEIELDTWEAQFHKWKEIVYPIILDTNNGEIWMMEQGKFIVYHYDCLRESFEQYNLRTKNDNGQDKLFTRIVTLKHGEMLMLPYCSSFIFVLDVNKQIHRIIIKNEDGEQIKYLCREYLEFEEEVWLLPHSNADVIVVNFKDYSLQYKKIPIPIGWEEKCNFILKMQASYRWSFPLYELKTNTTVEKFYYYIINKKENIVENINIRSINCGMEIWKYVNGS